mmetsp:Transcript_15806/g.33421  ORF Transcript_15806/g.33421 Transcript_15806/m.33421 type:complete len:258 (-) Transcript_15806:1588-2361(-)
MSPVAPSFKTPSTLEAASVSDDPQVGISGMLSSSSSSSVLPLKIGSLSTSSLLLVMSFSFLWSGTISTLGGVDRVSVASALSNNARGETWPTCGDAIMMAGGTSSGLLGDIIEIPVSLIFDDVTSSSGESSDGIFVIFGFCDTFCGISSTAALSSVVISGILPALPCLGVLFSVVMMGFLYLSPRLPVLAFSSLSKGTSSDSSLRTTVSLATSTLLETSLGSVSSLVPLSSTFCSLSTSRSTLFDLGAQSIFTGPFL